MQERVVLLAAGGNAVVAVFARFAAGGAVVALFWVAAFLGRPRTNEFVLINKEQNLKVLLS